MELCIAVRLCRSECGRYIKTPMIEDFAYHMLKHFWYVRLNVYNDIVNRLKDMFAYIIEVK